MKVDLDPSRMCPDVDALAPEIPRPADGSAVPEKLVEEYAKDVKLHLEALPSRPYTMGFLKRLFGDKGILPMGPGVVVWGGGHIGGLEFRHVEAVAGCIASKVPETQSLTVVTGSGSGVMHAAHSGATKVINGRAVCVGVTMQDLLHGNELPGDHNDHVITVRHMPRRIVAMAGGGHAIIVHPGGIGTTEEAFAAMALLTEPWNEGMTPMPVVLSDGAGKDSPWLQGMVDVVQAGVGKKAFEGAFIVQAGRDFTVLDSLGLRANDPNGFWRDHLVIPSEAFRPVQLSPNAIASLNLTDAQDDPTRFFADMRRFSQLVTDVLISDVRDPEGDRYLDRHGPMIVRISSAVAGPFDRFLHWMWSTRRIRTSRPMEEVVQWRVVR